MNKCKKYNVYQSKKIIAKKVSFQDAIVIGTRRTRKVLSSGKPGKEAKIKIKEAKC